MAHIMSLNSGTSCVMGIYIFRFKKYWQTVFNLLELNMSPTFKQYLQSETVNPEKKSYYH